MSLQKTITINGGIEVEGAYLKITKIDTTYIKDTAISTVVLTQYKNEEQKNLDNPIGRKIFNLKLNEMPEFSESELKKAGVSLVSKTYNYIKSLNEFSGAIDI